MPSRPRPIRSPSPLAHEAGHVGIGDTLNAWERLHGVHGSLEAMGGLAPMWGTRSAIGLPRTVIVNCSPFSTARSSLESWALASKAPMQESMAEGREGCGREGCGAGWIGQIDLVCDLV